MTEGVEHGEYCMFEFAELVPSHHHTTSRRHMTRRVYLNAVPVAPQLLVRYGVVIEPDGAMTPTPRTYSGWGYWILPPRDGPAMPTRGIGEMPIANPQLASD